VRCGTHFEKCCPKYLAKRAFQGDSRMLGTRSRMLPPRGPIQHLCIGNAHYNNRSNIMALFLFCVGENRLKISLYMWLFWVKIITRLLWQPCHLSQQSAKSISNWRFGCQEWRSLQGVVHASRDLTSLAPSGGFGMEEVPKASMKTVWIIYLCAVTLHK
jgi:hypothetical protein